MKTKLWVTGAKGQLGQSLAKYIDPKNYAILWTDYPEGDITQAKVVEQLFEKHSFDLVINCAAYTAVDLAESEPEKARAINVTGVQNIVDACSAHKASLIHISTDFVFDGTVKKPLTEAEPPNPQSVYGHTKWEGEQIVLNSDLTAAVLRTSWLFSEFGHNFVKTMLRLGREKSEISVVNDQIGTPTYASDLAQVVIQMLSKISELKQPEIFHFSNRQPCSWFDFATEIMKQGRLACRVKPVPTTDYPSPAKRPPYSVLQTQKIEDFLDLKNRSWQEALRECLNHIHP
ncbi:MAG: dTDP-4-dehydrorhamnose reductase [Flavobacteriaceae bacterium]